jgi:hypothetical protein
VYIPLAWNAERGDFDVRLADDRQDGAVLKPCVHGLDAMPVAASANFRSLQVSCKIEVSSAKAVKCVTDRAPDQVQLGRHERHGEGLQGRDMDDRR